MQEKWIKPDYEEIHVAGECTAYAAARAPTKTEQAEVVDVSRTRPKGYPELHQALTGAVLSGC
jgi:coenzyme PQQ precursor peptide PqqA